MISRSRLDVRLGQFRSSLTDLSGNLDRLRQQLRDIELQAESQMQSRLALSKDSAAGFDPLEFDRFTRVQELTRMMAESVNDVATVQRNLQRAMEGAEDDLIAQGRQARELTAAITSLGYREDREVSITSEGRRAIFDHPTVPRVHLDVFFDELEFCHRIPLAGRLEADRPTIPLAELLLSKLQIVRINEKDVVDTILLLLDHELGEGDADVIDLRRIAALCAEEWGLWRTLTMNLEKVAAFTASYPQVSEAQGSRVAAASAAIKHAIDAAPKPLAWRMRDRIGDRRQWWTDVDEVR